MTHENNEVKNPFISYPTTVGRDSDGVPYTEYVSVHPPLQEGDRYLRTLIDTRDNTIVDIAIVVHSKHEYIGNLVGYVTTRRGLFIRRVAIQSDLSFICASHGANNPLPENLFSIIEVAKAEQGNAFNVNPADWEAAKRLATDVIRPNKEGVDVNYGRLAVGHLQGIPFLGDVEGLIDMGVPCIYVSRIPKFVEDGRLKVTWQEKGVERAVTIYALEREDIAPLGSILSKNDRLVTYWAGKVDEK